MNRYQTRTPRAAFAIAAAALTAATLGLAVFVPATMDAVGPDVHVLAATKSPAPTEVAISPARIEVTGVREPEVASTHDKGLARANDRQG